MMAEHLSGLGIDPVAKQRRALLIAVCVGVGSGVLATVVALQTYEIVMREWLLRTLVDGGNYSLEDDFTTKMRLEALVPRLIEMHFKASLEPGSGELKSDTSNMEAFNRRIRAWNALLQAVRLTQDSKGHGYLWSITQSESASSQERSDAQELLDLLWPTAR